MAWCSEAAASSRHIVVSGYATDVITLKDFHQNSLTTFLSSERTLVLIVIAPTHRRTVSAVGLHQIQYRVQCTPHIDDSLCHNNSAKENKKKRSLRARWLW